MIVEVSTSPTQADERHYNFYGFGGPLHRLVDVAALTLALGESDYVGPRAEIRVESNVIMVSRSPGIDWEAIEGIIQASIVDPQERSAFKHFSPDRDGITIHH